MLVTICAFSLTACGKKEETAAYQQITDDMVSNCAEVSQSAVESLAGFDDETLNQMTANRDTFTRLAVSAWNANAFLKVGDVKIELLEPTSPESTIAKFIEKNNGNGGMHHLAFAVEDGVANALAEAETTGIRLIDKAPRKGAEGLQIAFLHPKSTLGVLTELCEKP